MAPLSQEDIKRLQADMSTLLEKHGFTGAYLVAEHRVGDNETAQQCVVALSAVSPSMPTKFIDALAKQTFSIVKSVSKMEVHLRDN
ncbi:hypothetical protein [Spirosoma areae]